MTSSVRRKGKRRSTPLRLIVSHALLLHYQYLFITTINSIIIIVIVVVVELPCLSAPRSWLPKK
jgi:hypothetical protein